MREITRGVETTRGYISAKFLLAEPPQGYVIPEGFKITKLPCRGYVAGAKRKSGGAMLGATCPRSVWK